MATGSRLRDDDRADGRRGYRTVEEGDGRPVGGTVKRALITGISGFAGSHLAEHLLAHGWQVHGFVRNATTDPNLSGIVEKLTLHTVDLAQRLSLVSLIEAIEPTGVFHLAARSFIPEVRADPATAVDVNIRGSLLLFEACRMLPRNLRPRIIFVSSAEVYGDYGAGPIDEGAPAEPVTLYGVTKRSVEMLAATYCRSGDLDIVTLRPFNHTGPRQSPRFVCSDFARQIAVIEKKGVPGKLRVGNLSARRDFSDVRDIVTAYRLAFERGRSGEIYNVCSGRGVTIEEILDTLRALSTATIEVETDPARLRPIDTPEIVGDCRRLTETTGWHPLIPLQRTLHDLLDYWRKVV
ncbi:MAG: SDR family oxidoreductase [Deltaproteobacteria bacterium]|nr:MAG: SDR family oxidoreductase [Deltaproteobacteria bacterium]